MVRALENRIKLLIVKQLRCSFKPNSPFKVKESKKVRQIKFIIPTIITVRFAANISPITLAYRNEIKKA
jgi:hypothetical protein